MTTAALTFRLGGEWIAATRRETQKLLDERVSEDELAPCVDAFLETVASIDRAWQRFIEMLKTVGLPSQFTGEVVQSMRSLLGDTRKLLHDLQEHAGNRHADLDAAGAMFDRIEQNLEAIESTPIPEVDPERVRRGLEEAARGEGEDVEDLLMRFARTGRL
jgi:hypothetical protein